MVVVVVVVVEVGEARTRRATPGNSPSQSRSRALLPRHLQRVRREVLKVKQKLVARVEAEILQSLRPPGAKPWRWSTRR